MIQAIMPSPHKQPYELTQQQIQQLKPYVQKFLQSDQFASMRKSVQSNLPQAEGLFSTLKQNLKKLVLAAGVFVVAKKLLGNLKSHQS